ncbi:MAG: hypothetical protein WC220_02340 [Pedobacter sp.]|jgi:hypothetical protein
MSEYKRKYHFRSGNQSKESRLFWIFLFIGLAIGAAIIYYF